MGRKAKAIAKAKGKANVEKGSESGVGLRRSSRLADKAADPATNLSKSSESVKRTPSNSISASQIGAWFIDDRGTPEETDQSNREMRQLEGETFEYSYQSFGNDEHKDRFIQETRHIVASGNVSVASLERSHGIPWVAVHGVRSICVVYKEDELEVNRICDFLKEDLEIEQCGEYLLSQMENLADSKDLARKPFAVVSVNSFSNPVKESCDKQAHVPDKDTAIRFLRSKLETKSAIGKDETIQIAIGAFQQLFKQEFKAEEINVYFFDDDEYDEYLMESDVELHLTAVKQQQQQQQSTSQ